MLGPYTEEEELIAESMVAEAIAGMERAVPPVVLEEIRAAMVDELLCTAQGRAKLRPFVKQAEVDESAEIARVPTRKKETGSA